MKHVRIRKIGDLMMSKNVWKLSNGNVAHEEFPGDVTPEMANNEYIINIDDKTILLDKDELETTHIYNKLVGSVPHEMILYGWMVDDLGKYVPSIDEIINMM